MNIPHVPGSGLGVKSRVVNETFITPALIGLMFWWGGAGPGDGSTTSSCNTVCGERKERGRLDNPGWGCKADSRSGATQSIMLLVVWWELGIYANKEPGLSGRLSFR